MIVVPIKQYMIEIIFWYMKLVYKAIIKLTINEIGILINNRRYAGLNQFRTNNFLFFIINTPTKKTN